MKEIITTSFSDSIQEEYMKKLEAELLSYLKIQAEHHAKGNQPVTEQQYLALVHNKIQVTIQEAIHFNQQRNLPVSGLVIANSIHNAAQEKMDEIQSRIHDDEHKLDVLRNKIKELGEGMRKRIWRKLEVMIATAFGIVEGFFAYDALRGASFHRLTAFVTATGIAMAATLGIHVASEYINKTKTKFQRRVRYCIALSVGFLTSLVLGSLRANLYNSIVDLSLQPNAISITDKTNISGCALAVISFILFLVALGFAVKYWRSQDEKRQERIYDEKCVEIEKLENEIRQNESKKVAIENEALQAEAMAKKKFEYALSIENRCINIAKQAQEVYKDSNLRYRSDGLCPVFFSYPPEFKFQLFFDIAKQK